MKKPLLWFVLAAAPITILCVGIYAVGQQIYRQDANDPQIQMAEDGAARLNTGGVPADLVTRGIPLVDIATSLDSWVAVYDREGTVLESSAQFENAPPKLPAGVFDTTNASAYVDGPVWRNGEDRITWQPQVGVRQAVVLVQAKNGDFVAAGRSLRLSEDRTQQLGFNMIFGWLGALVITFIWSFIVWWVFKPAK